MYPRILSACFFCLFFAACEQQEQTEDISNIIEVETAAEKLQPQKSEAEKSEAEKTVLQKPRPVLKLSLDDISIDYQTGDKDIFNNEKQQTEVHSETFKILSKESEPNTSLSGKVVTDEEKIENEEYIDSIDGVQINIERSFQ